MSIQELRQKQIKINNHIIDGRISMALPLISELTYTSHQGEFIDTLENLEVTYKNILRYSFTGTPDPQRGSIYNNLLRQMLELSDKVFAHYFKKIGWGSISKKAEEDYLLLDERAKSALIDELNSEREFNLFLKEVNQSTSEGQLSEKYSTILTNVFNILWLKGKYYEGEKQMTLHMIDGDIIPWYDKSLIVSAISLSLFNEFDIEKIELLFSIYEKQQKEVSHRALVGIIIGLLVHNKRLFLYPEVIIRLKTIISPELLAKQAEQILIQFIKSQETEKVTERIQKEILPEVMKYKPDIEEKLNLDDLISKDEFEDKNPDWENFFGDSPEVYKKLEEFSNMQMDGSDVFMGAFSMLKRFGFFECFPNWFLPFYKDHPEIQKSVEGVDINFDWKNFFEGIESAPVMCNSDKYSFCFNIGFMPDMQKSMMLELFNMELQQMQELAEDDQKHDANAQNRIIYTQYIQDLYRFYKLHPDKERFKDVFNIELDIVNTPFLQEIFYKSESLRRIGEFYFSKTYFASALRIFENLKESSSSFELIEKIGFCYQKLEMYSKAIEKYKEAEILESNRSWLQKKLGYCYRKIGQFDKAIEYYSYIEKNEPDNLEIQVYLGQLYIDKEDFENALKYYYKVEYLKPNFTKAQRPIAWCSFLLHKPDQAVNYFNKVIEINGTRSDYLNLAHCYWVKGELSNAIDHYRRAIKHAGGDKKWFRDSMQKDSEHLAAYGIESIDIALMTDYIIIGD